MIAKSDAVGPSKSPAGDGSPPLPALGLNAWLPGLRVLRHYRAAWLGRDIGAGLVLTALLVPAGMGYAEASALPAVSGLYASVGASLAYALFGPSRIMVLRPDSSLAPLIAAVVLAKAGGDPVRAMTLAPILALLTSALWIGAGIAKDGFLTELISKPVRVGYMNGIALTIIVTQLPKLFGFSASASNMAMGTARFVRDVIAGHTQLPALAIGAACLVVIVIGRAVAPRAPTILLAVASATVAVTGLSLSHLVAVVGPVPRGLPLPALPALRASDALELLVAAVGIGLVAFADTSVLSRTFAGRQGYRVNPNRELKTLGAELAFAEMKDPVRDRLERYGLQKQIGRDFFFPTLGVAVKAFLDRHGVAWVDWEESRDGGVSR